MANSRKFFGKTIRVADHSFGRRGHLQYVLANGGRYEHDDSSHLTVDLAPIKSPYLSLESRRDLRLLPIRVRPAIRPAVTAPSRFAAAISDPDFVAIAIFCAIGLLATVNVMLRVSNLGLM
jgi:hypothetical protein